MISHYDFNVFLIQVTEYPGCVLLLEVLIFGNACCELCVVGGACDKFFCVLHFSLSSPLTGPEFS